MVGYYGFPEWIITYYSWNIMICHDSNIIVTANCRFSWGLHNTHAIASTTNDFDNLKDNGLCVIP